MEIEFTLRCEPEQMPYKGNCSAVDEDSDRETEQWIADQLASGNEWAWCWVLVEAKIELDGEEFVGSASLGGCSYESEAGFREDQYYQDLKIEARDALISTLRGSGKRGRTAARALEGLIARNLVPAEIE